jgi:hypothetical protein
MTVCGRDRSPCSSLINSSCTPPQHSEHALQRRDSDANKGLPDGGRRQPARRSCLPRHARFRGVGWECRGSGFVTWRCRVGEKAWGAA